MSRALRSALTKLGIVRLGDLAVVSDKDFARVSPHSSTLVLELRELMAQARSEQLSAPGAHPSGDVLRQVRVGRPATCDASRAGPEAASKGTVSCSGASPWSDRAAEPIYIPQEARGQPLSACAMSTRLANVLTRRGFRLLGDLHGIPYAEFLRFRNCGKKSLQELRQLVQAVQHGHPQPSAGEIRALLPAPVPQDCFSIPAGIHDLNPFDLPLSPRLERALAQCGVQRFGDLQGVRWSDFRRLGHCGRRTLAELLDLLGQAAAGEFEAPQTEFSPARCGELVRWLDSLFDRLPARDREILFLRLGSMEEPQPTLEEIGAQFGLTRERVRQIANHALTRLRKHGGPNLAAQLRGLAAACLDRVCPFTPALLASWLGQHVTSLRLPLAAYVRLLGQMDPAIPAWPDGQEPLRAALNLVSPVGTALVQMLRAAPQGLSLRQALEQVRARPGLSRLTPGELLATLRRLRDVRVDLPKPDEPLVRLARLPLAEVARAVLEASQRPLTPEEILARAQARVGPELANWNPRSMANSLTPERGFYLLGPRAYGLRQHFILSERLWPTVRMDFKRLLATENRPVSTAEVVNENRFPWARATNAYELAHILRQDRHFADLGRFLFGLAAWDIKERPYVKDLIPQVLAEAGRPLSSEQVAGRLKRFRSVSAFSVSSLLRQHPLVRDFGFGYFGLRVWGDSARQHLVANAPLIERLIRRAEPPLPFARLCEILAIPSSGPLAEGLWRTVGSLASVIRSPEESGPGTLILHRSCPLKRALVATAKAVNRPLALYEFQWELSERFGRLFGHRSPAGIKRCLEQSGLFLRDANGAFVLDTQLERLGLDEEAIRQACLELLSQTNEIVGCEDLIERLEAEGKRWEELSPDILGALLRKEGVFQEIGHNRFRAKPCKR